MKRWSLQLPRVHCLVLLVQPRVLPWQQSRKQGRPVWHPLLAPHSQSPLATRARAPPMGLVPVAGLVQGRRAELVSASVEGFLVCNGQPAIAKAVGTVSRCRSAKVVWLVLAPGCGWMPDAPREAAPRCAFIKRPSPVGLQVVVGKEDYLNSQLIGRGPQQPTLSALYCLPSRATSWGEVTVEGGMER